MIGFDVTDVTAINIGNIGIGSIYVGGTKIWEDTPTPPVHDYERDYFTTVAKESGIISFVIPSDVSTSDFTSISYSTDDGSTWTTTNNEDDQTVTITVSVNGNDKVLWKGTGGKIGDGNNTQIIDCTGNFDVEGNIMSLLNGDNFYHSTLDTNYDNQFSYLFNNEDKLKDASNLILPATTLADNCYSGMFNRCFYMTAAPALPATTLADYCYQYMFADCFTLTAAPALPATTLADNCYAYMFIGCHGFTSTPELPATQLAPDCYTFMFQGCNNLTTVTSLPATTLAGNCYYAMFYRCGSLTNVPSTLPATELAERCYGDMFTECTSLTTVPELPATTLVANCYNQMFKDCRALTTAPELPATTLANSCYQRMFSGCTNLNNIKMLATDISASECLTEWVDGVSATGTFVKDANATIPTGVNGIPDGWTVEDYPPTPVHDYERDYLTTVAKGSGNMTFDIPAEITTNEVVSVSYSTDGGNTWTTTNNVDNQQITITVPVNNGDKVLWKGNADKYFIYSGGNYYGKLNGTIDFDAEGNIMSLLYGDNFYQTSLSSTSTLFGLFYGSNIVNASNLILSSITATHDCYFWMFCGCTKLTDAPKINATTLDGGCYYGMFQDCTSLTTAPTLPATTLAMNCYVSMFSGCTSLTTAPALPATTIGDSCYDSMFSGCTNLTTAPLTLPATTLANGCYREMFNGCTSLTTAPALPATTLVESCYGGMFRDCTSLTNVPTTLPATTLKYFCYQNMFMGCSSLTTAPILPATTLTDSCYDSMFDGCSSLNYIKMLATDISASSCLAGWVDNVSTTGTFVKNASMTTLPTGTSGIPSGWTVQDDTSNLLSSVTAE